MDHIYVEIHFFRCHLDLVLDLLSLDEHIEPQTKDPHEVLQGHTLSGPLTEELEQLAGHGIPFKGHCESTDRDGFYHFAAWGGSMVECRGTATGLCILLPSKSDHQTSEIGVLDNMFVRSQYENIQRFRQHLQLVLATFGE